jgi:pilus assembly protein Flp/PilA
MLEMIQFQIFQLINRFRKDEEGAALVEYGMLVGLIAVVCIGAVTLLGGTINNILTNVADTLSAAM